MIRTSPSSRQRSHRRRRFSTGVSCSIVAPPHSPTPVRRALDGRLADRRRYTGFREDSGDCSQAVIFSKDIKAKRAGRQSNLVFVSTCHAADSNTTLPDAFAIAKTKSSGSTNQGPEFYVGYIGVQWDSDEW